jgi:hypothetical protein
MKPFTRLGAASIVLAAACAVRLGGPEPEVFQTLAIQPPAGATPEQVAETIRGAGAALVLVTAERDSAWFAGVASAADLALSGPSTTEPAAKAFLTSRLELLGDTSIVLGVSDGTRMHVHDALYQISEGRLVDLMFVSVAPDSDLREATRSLLGYVATDVGSNAALIIALTTPSPAAGDSIALLLRAAYATARECAGDDSGIEEGRVRLLYGPSARMRCQSARSVPDAGDAVTAQLVVGR